MKRSMTHTDIPVVLVLQDLHSWNKFICKTLGWFLPSAGQLKSVLRDKRLCIATSVCLWIIGFKVLVELLYKKNWWSLILLIKFPSSYECLYWVCTWTSAAPLIYSVTPRAQKTLVHPYIYAAAVHGCPYNIMYSVVSWCLEVAIYMHAGINLLCAIAM